MRTFFAALLLLASACASAPAPRKALVLDYDTLPTPPLQSQLEAIDQRVRAELSMTSEPATGILDFETGEVVMIHPDRIEYAASVAKVGILYAWFHLHGHEPLDDTTRHELGLMIKSSSNEMAAKYSRLMGLREIQDILNAAGFYDAAHGGGLWVGKHYGPNSERIGDPVADHSHAVTVRQMLRFYLLLEQRTLVSADASRTMREIFESPSIPHDDVKFVKGLAGRDVHVIRKLGTWQNWLHDTAVVTAHGRHYAIVALTNDARGDEYLEHFAREVDDLMIRRARP